MTKTLEQRFADVHDDYHKFERVQHPLSTRTDLCAFVLLAKLDPSGRDMVAAAEHDEIYLGVDMDSLHRNATDEDILTLVRCGVRYDSCLDCLCMFV